MDGLSEVVSDMVEQQGGPLMLKAETRRTFFSRGGKLIEFLADGKSIGDALPGETACLQTVYPL